MARVLGRKIRMFHRKNRRRRKYLPSALTRIGAKSLHLAALSLFRLFLSIHIDVKPRRVLDLVPAIGLRPRRLCSFPKRESRSTYGNQRARNRLAIRSGHAPTERSSWPQFHVKEY